MRPMNVTIVCDVLGEANNGTTLAAWNLIRYLRDKGHHVTVVSPDPRTRGKQGYLVVPPVHLGFLLGKVLQKNGVRPARADRRTLRESMRNADVVHVQVPLLLGCSAVRVAREMGKPITASFHCQAENITAHIGLMNCRSANRLLYRIFYSKVYRYCDRVHYPTEFIRETFEETAGRTPGVVISNGVSEAFFEPSESAPDPDRFTIVSTGRYSREKAQWQLIEAVGRSPYRDRIRVILAGDGPYGEALGRRARRLRVDCVRRFYTRGELIRVLRGADLYVHTALVEIEAIACMEAIVCGLVPVICNSERSATRFFALDERSLFEPKDVRGLADRIGFWIEHGDLRRAYAERYRRSSEEFSLDNCMRQMERMLLSAAGQDDEAGEEPCGPQRQRSSGTATS